MHGDYRLDNMLFGQAGADRPLTVVDWQTVTWGPAMIDVAYFLGCALPDDSAARATTTRCCAPTTTRLGAEPSLSLDDVREGVRRQSFFGVMMAIVSSMLVERTERGDEMFMTMLRRHSSARARHRRAGDAACACRPRTAAARLPTTRAAHPPGAEPLWSESWYADFVDEAQGVGGWFRLGLMPNQNDRVGQRAAVRTRHAHRRRQRLRGSAARRPRRRPAPMPSS